MFAIAVPKAKAESLRLLLTDLGLLDKDHKIIVEDETVRIPILRKPIAEELRQIEKADGELASLSEVMPRERFYEPMKEILKELDLPEESRLKIPQKWEMFGNVLVLKLDEELDSQKSEIARVYADVLGAKTVLRDTGGISGEFREPVLKLLLGSETDTLHVENGVKFSFDVSKIMFSSGNVDERIRMASICKQGEVVVDMFAGIGYFSLPISIHSSPAKVISYEINPVAFDYLKKNIELNDVGSIVEPHLADCLDAEEGVADRVLMGYVGTTHEFLPKAIRILKREGIIHYHETCPNDLLPERPTQRVFEAAESLGRSSSVNKIKNIKSYAPGVSHVVLDVKIE